MKGKIVNTYKATAKQWHKDNFTDTPGVEGPYRVLKVKSIKVPKNMQEIELTRNIIWGNPSRIRRSTVTEFSIENHIDNGDIDQPYVLIYAKHNLPWQIYTDSGFEKNFSKMASKLLKIPNLEISFTEQGMQQDRVASLETEGKRSACALGQFVFENIKK